MIPLHPCHQQTFTFKCPSEKGGVSWAPIHEEMLLGPVLGRSYTGSVTWVTTAPVSSWVQRLWHDTKWRHLFTTHLPNSSSCIHSTPSSAVFPEPRGGDGSIPFRVDHSTLTHSWRFGQLWVSALTGMWRGKKVLWWRLDTTLICGWEHGYQKAVDITTT